MISFSQISLYNYPFVAFFSSTWIMNEYIKNFDEVNDEIFKEVLIHEYRRVRRDYPDYIYSPYLNEFSNFEEFFIESLDSLSDFFEWKFDNLWIKSPDKFEEWQNIITFISPLLPISYFFYKQGMNERVFFDYFINKYSLLLSYYDSFFESEINGEICELHIHLNGTTESDKVWIDVLKRPYDFYEDLKKGFSKNKEVRQLYHQIDINLDEKKFFKYLLFARKIRDYLYRRYIENDEIELIYPDEIEDMSICENDKLVSYINHPMEKIYESNNDLLLEGLFYFKMFDNFKDMSLYDKKLFHLYSLIKSLFLRLIIQQLDQYGFDQFQYITMNEMREMSEKSYLHRFNQLNSFYGSQLHHLEGRFAPKSDKNKMKRLIDTIIKDYKNFSNKRYSFTLVAHFIKKEDKPHIYYPYRFYELRNDIKKQVINLISILNLDEYEYRDEDLKYRDFIKGIDAAANELQAPPEVFGPIFRMISRRFREKSFLRGNSHLGITYHCGEDFVHLVSGMRAIFEAVRFLDMREKDRIGHGTAIGISPKIWLKKIPPKIKIKKGEWLDNLIFAYYLITENGLYFEKIHILENEIIRLFREIYNQQPTLSEIINSYFLRKLDPEVVLRFDISSIASMDFEEMNFEKIVGFRPLDSEIELFRLYHSYHCYEEYNREIEIETDFFDKKILKEFQEIILKELNSKQIAIETMPTSNLRISFYESYKDHHIFRWLEKVKNKPDLVICSDDPGIFATNLRNEYLHVKRFIKDRNQLVEIAKNSKRYKF